MGQGVRIWAVLCTYYIRMDVSGAGKASEYNYHVLPRLLTPDVESLVTGTAQGGGQTLQFPVGSALVFAIVSMATRAIRVIDFMVDYSNLQIISTKPSSPQ